MLHRQIHHGQINDFSKYMLSLVIAYSKTAHLEDKIEISMSSAFTLYPDIFNVKNVKHGINKNSLNVFNTLHS